MTSPVPTNMFNQPKAVYADAGLNEDGKPIEDPGNVSGGIADEFGGAGGAIDELINARK